MTSDIRTFLGYLTPPQMTMKDESGITTMRAVAYAEGDTVKYAFLRGYDEIGNALHAAEPGAHVCIEAVETTYVRKSRKGKSHRYQAFLVTSMTPTNDNASEEARSLASAYRAISPAYMSELLTNESTYVEPDITADNTL